MGQLLLQDNIPNIVVASTTSVTLAATNQGQPTTVTVGGQQYSLSSQLTLNTGSTGANGLDVGSLGAIQLWYVYAIVNSSTFSLALIASQTAPSAGPSIPAGYFSAYKPVGAFYTNGSSQVGVIVSNISTYAGTPWLSVSTSSSLFSVDTGTLNVSNVNVFMKREGDSARFRYEWSFGGTQTSWTSLYLSLPASLSIDTNKFPAATLGGNRYLWQTTGSLNKPGSFGGQDLILDSNSGPPFLVGLRVVAGAGTVNSTGFTGISAANQTYSGNAISAQIETILLPISGWNETLL